MAPISHISSEVENLRNMDLYLQATAGRTKVLQNKTMNSQQYLQVRKFLTIPLLLLGFFFVSVC